MHSSAPEPLETELRAVVRAGTEQLLARAAAAFAARPSWAEGLRAVAYELRDFLREDPGRARAMVLEAPHGDPETRRTREVGVEGLTALIDLGRAELPDPEALPRAVAALTAGVVYNRIHVGVEVGVESLEDEMVRELMYTAVMPYLGIEAALAELSTPRPPR